MMRRIFAAAVTSAFLAVAIAPTVSAQEKKTTPQQQKMKDCAAKWKDEKAKTGAKGREAYRTYMSGCLKA
jgi:psiF repeat